VYIWEAILCDIIRLKYSKEVPQSMKTDDDIKNKIEWFNNEFSSLMDEIKKWFKELGYTVNTHYNKINMNEQYSGEYKSKECVFKINDKFELKFVPYGIWLIGANGGINIYGPSGKEKIVHFNKGGPSITIKTDNTKTNTKFYSDVTTDGWYWYDESSNIRQVYKLSKDIILSLLESLQ
jgi:hypothetical protein